ncbi:related to tol protein [Fusarium fujikuroi]|nr:tol protein [Fusarium fujikuroi]SCN76494.1 related to tol protein [Fusarium fujikuroi]SCN87388.1 related to tol protein [Fusarium fujikuroi]SCO16466.1 related to tol protein [Fusarium fujikuroi]SCO31083.1 related to tol protein [Fusarium fujikuroi]
MPRCAFCRAFTIDQDRFYLEFHPNLASLKKSAGDGCDFCHLCWIGFQREWAPSEIETVLKGEVPEGVTKFEPGIWIYVHFTDYSPTLTQPRIIASCGRYNPITSVKESSHGLSYINLAVYGKEGTAASSRTPGRICTAEYEPDSYITLIRRFLERCTKSHQACGADETYEMPTRVIDVGNAKQGDLPRLIVTGQSMKEKYLALSYCWGPGKDTFTLNHKTMEGMLKSIDESRLVAAHGDTIALARQLGIRYIWIDALCIIQGDKDDWERESKLMAKVYGHATLTITAGRSGDARNSFIANTYKQSAPCCEFPLGDGLGGNVLVGPLRSNDYGITETRGWCCQEKRLSRRVVFFGKEQLFFLCRSSGYSEDRSYQEGKSVLLHSFLKDGNGSPQSTRDRLLQYWDEIVVDFSRRQLSNPHDIFAALASIAEPISKALQSRYLADLWEDDLVRCLLWRPGYRVSSFFGPATRPLPTIFASAPVIRAPSWSWASIRWRQASHTPTISENEDREPKRNTIDKAEARPLDGRSSLWT